MQHMGQKRRCNGNVGYNVTTEDLYDPEFNILCGAIYLGILIDRHTENGLLRLDKIVTRYNVGFFTKVKGKTPEEVMLNSNKETRAYIKKLVGTNGVLDIIDI
jgi:soluble lytic murein transglycosylase-like protein